MATDRSRDLYRGLLIPDGSITEIWPEETTVDEAGNRTGIPDSTSQTEMIVESTGSQLDAGPERRLEVLTLRGGYPGAYEAGFGWRKALGVNEDFRGWDPPLTVSQFEVVDSQASVKHYLHMHLVGKVNPDGSDHLFCFHEFVTGVPPNANNRVLVTRRDDSGWLTSGAWPVVIGSTDQSYDALNMHPSGIVLPSGRLLCFFFVYSTDVVLAGSFEHIFANVRMKYSDDDGLTWELGSKFCLRERIKVPPAVGIGSGADTVIPHRMRAAYKDGQILLLVWYRLDPKQTEQDGIRQYASDDLGTSFQFVSESFGQDPDVEPFCHDITVGSGNFVIGWIDQVGDSVHVDVIGSAYEPINWQIPKLPCSDSNACRPTQTAWPDWEGIEEDGDLTITTDADGTLYLYSFSFPYSTGGILDSSSGVVFKSLAGGSPETWVGVGHGFGSGNEPIVAFNIGTFWKSRTNDSQANYLKPVNITAAPHRGRIAVAHRETGGIPTQQQEGEAPFPGSFFVFWIGGFSQVVEPSLGAFSRSELRSCFCSTWFPYTEPATPLGGMWALVVAGPPALASVVQIGRYRLTTPPTCEHYFEDTQPSAALPVNSQVQFTEGFIGRFTCEVVNAPSAQRINALIAEGGGAGVEVSILIRDNQVRILDNMTGATLGGFAPPGGMLGIKYQYLWAFRGTLDVGGNPDSAEFSIWFREWNANEDRTWSLGFESTTFTLAPAPADSRIQWGAVAGFGGIPPTQSDMFWDEFQFTFGEVDDGAGDRYPLVGLQIAQGQTTPDDLYGRSFASSPVYVDAQARIASTDGPTFEGDTWNLDVRHLLGVENVLTQNSPSPSIVWRSKTAANDQIIAWKRNPDGADAFPGNNLYGVHFAGVNFKRARVEALVGGVWQTLGDVDLFKSYNYSREGNSIRTPVTLPLPGSQGMYVSYNELKGCKFEFANDAPLGEVATIERNSEGMGYYLDASAGVTEVKRATLFLDPDTYTEATAPSSGLGRVWFPNVTALFNIRAGGKFEAIRIRLCPTGALPPEGRFVAGNIITGPVAVFGWDYSRERMVNREANTKIVTNRDGSKHAYIAGEPNRSVRFSWKEGVDITQLRREYGVGESGWDYVKTWTPGSAVPVAMRYDGPLLMDGLIERLQGPALPVVYIPRIERSGDTMLVDPRQFDRGSIYGRVVSKVTREQVVGAEETSEVYRVNTITIEGEK